MRQPPEKSVHGRCCIVGVEAEAGEDRRGARGRRMRADVGEPRLDLGDAVRVVRGLGLGEKPRALGIGREHDLDQAVPGPFGASCASRPMRARDGIAIGPCSSGSSPRIARNSVVLPVPLRPIEADARAVRNARRGAVEQQASGDAQREVVDDEHAGVLQHDPEKWVPVFATHHAQKF